MTTTYDELLKNFKTWHSVSLKEAYDEQDSRKDRKKFVGITGTHFDISEKITPVDMYCLLKNNFGPPNGIQMLLKSQNDVDNLIHWAWELKYKDAYIHISGFFFHFSVLIKGAKDVTDKEKDKFVDLILRCLMEVRDEVEKTKTQLEEWLLFSNPYAQFSDMVDEITNELEVEPKLQRLNARPDVLTPDFQAKVTNISSIFASTFRRRITLKLIIPIWIESFINLIIFLCAKPELRNTEELKKYKKSKWRIRLGKIHVMCSAISAVDMNSKEIKDIEHLFSNRNRLLHGGIEPEVNGKKMYFAEKYIPLLDENCYLSDFFHDISLHGLEVEELFQEVETARNFIAYIFERLDPKFARRMLPIINDSNPGWDIKRKIAGNLLPKQLVDMFPRFDTNGTTVKATTDDN